jgi:hypothetical protein
MAILVFRVRVDHWRRRRGVGVRRDLARFVECQDLVRGEHYFEGLLQIEWVIFVILRAIPVFDGDAIAD